ncbi:hypothetical protein C2845_PM12G16570 [Panicum miliaceum]|uniref:Uncharacterized protein n=1 Tax=Panicum miliaceum TaxID=4540 RepID=A0A3L6QGD2_PANMI|nr:hypothetical protein C2845_PM12G16570 [Panicum miliaceum]
MTMWLMKISIYDEYSLFQSSEDSISSSNKIRDSVNTPSMEKSLETEATIHATRKKVLKNNDSEPELPSFSHWLKPANPKKPFRDEALTGDRSHSAKSSDEDRPIIGMVAAHWKDKEPVNFTPKWFDGNGIPNSTKKYKEDQKVSWRAILFGERLEKALSEEKLLSERGIARVERRLSFWERKMRRVIPLNLTAYMLPFMHEKFCAPRDTEAFSIRKIFLLSCSLLMAFAQPSVLQ